MRLNKILAIAAVCVIAKTAFAQQQPDVVIRFSGYTSATTVAHDQLGAGDTSVGLSYQPFAPNFVGVVPAFISVTPRVEWLTAGNVNLRRWATFNFTITYNYDAIDLVFRNQADDGDVYVARDLRVGDAFSLYISNNGAGGANGVAAGQLLAKDTTNRTAKITFALGSTTNNNGRSTDGYLRDPFISTSNGQLIGVWVNAPYIVSNFGGAYSPIPGTGNENQLIQVRTSPTGQGDQTNNVRVHGLFLVPEPASMIALGSGLVGLLALRRRRAN